MHEAARAFALLVDQELRTKEAILRTLVNSQVLARGDWNGLYDYAKLMAPTPETVIILTLPNGEQLLNTRVPLGAPLPTRRSSNLSELIRKHGADNTLVSDLFFAPVGKRYDFTVQVPVKSGQDIPYFLVMGISASQMQKVLIAQRFPQQWIGTIVDQIGRAHV